MHRCMTNSIDVLQERCVVMLNMKVEELKFDYYCFTRRKDEYACYCY